MIWVTTVSLYTPKWNCLSVLFIYYLLGQWLLWCYVGHAFLLFCWFLFWAWMISIWLTSWGYLSIRFSILKENFLSCTLILIRWLFLLWKFKLRRQRFLLLLLCNCVGFFEFVITFEYIKLLWIVITVQLIVIIIVVNKILFIFTFIQIVLIALCSINLTFRIIA